MTSQRLSQVATILATLIMVWFGFAIFLEAGEPMANDAVIAQAWVDALCERDLDTLYTLSVVPDGMDRERFKQRVDQYLQSGEFPTPCAGEVNVHIIRNVAIPDGLEGDVREVRYIPEVHIRYANGAYHAIPMWVYRVRSGEWKVRPEFLGPMASQAAPQGSMVALLDSNNIPLGYVRVRDNATVYEQSTKYLVRVPVTIQTLTFPWELYEFYLFSGNLRGRGVMNDWDLPEADKDSFMPAQGGYISQGIQFDTDIWFILEELNAPLTLGVIGITPQSGVPPTTFFEVNYDLIPEEQHVFNPFQDVELRHYIRDAVVFDLTIDTTGMLQDDIMFACQSFILEMQDASWLPASHCDFVPDVWSLWLERDERIRTTITFDYPGDKNNIRVFTYRLINQELTRYVLWENDEQSE
ncbi:MAG: hypothetical protein Kow00117_12350 [Phototrophicales bacterium]